MDFRLDRLATLYMVLPCLRLASRGEQSIPILMYHSISDDDESDTHGYYRTKTSPAVFAAQLKYLHDSGYTTCSLAQAIQQLQTKMQAAAKLVAITFDDGYCDFYRHAFPALNQYGFSATVFLPTAYIGDRPVQFKGKDCLTWGEVRELNNHGILFGSHTVTHPQLRELSASAINVEIRDSKTAIEEKLGSAVDSFAYPYAFPQTDSDFTNMLRDSLRQAGYQNGVCTIVGRATRNSEPLFLERLPVNSCDDRALFSAKLAGAYDWICTSQYVTKMVKTLLRGPGRGVKHSISKDFPAVQ
ncbi:MAG: polysaccharide deacetylase family protein [Candidatus Sulfotelmatobacter sp.]|jgi:peptidoglycan/xylan/chitin deacetylase (PgdA/CDA1 family)